MTTCGQALYELLELSLPGSGSTLTKQQTILINGGRTATGIMGIQYAKLSGLITVLSTYSLHNFDCLKSLGADWVFDYHTVQRN